MKRLSHEQSRRNSARRRRKVAARHAQAGRWSAQSAPMLSTGKVHYEIGVNTWHGAQGSLSIASWSLLMTEAASKRRVWLGFARAEVHVGLSDTEREQRFRETTCRLLDDFPPAQRGD